LQCELVSLIESSGASRLTGPALNPVLAPCQQRPLKPAKAQQRQVTRLQRLRTTYHNLEQLPADEIYCVGIFLGNYLQTVWCLTSLIMSSQLGNLGPVSPRLSSVRWSCSRVCDKILLTDPNSDVKYKKMPFSASSTTSTRSPRAVGGSCEERL
jgi:hypothetical protein